ncbi:MAG: TIGR02206 family membrane protein [Candidatus Dormiibacterota bacterium]
MDQSASFGHLLAIGTTIISVVILVSLAHFRPGAWITPVCWLLAAILVGAEVSWQVIQWRGLIDEPDIPTTWGVSYSLPLYVCDVSAFVGAAALLSRKQILVDVVWYWGLAGTLQGIATPDHPIAFPSYDWLEFYGTHIGVVVTAFWLVVGLGLHPRRRAALRVVAISVGFIALVGLVDALSGGDYDYLHTSSPPGLLHLLGPWPWYVFAATGVGLLSILIVDLPFWPERRRARRRGAAAGPAAQGTVRSSAPG